MSEKYRKVLMMFYWEGRTAVEIAEEMGITVKYEPGARAVVTGSAAVLKPGAVWNNNVWVILHRARKELLHVMTREQEERDAAAAGKASACAAGGEAGGVGV